MDDAPPQPQGPSVTMMVGMGAALLFAILLGYLVLGKSGFEVEIENMSDSSIQGVEIKINGETYPIGDMRANEVNNAHPRCSPGNDVEVSYGVPNRGRFTKKLPKKDAAGKPLELDFAEYKGRCRIRLELDGIREVEY